MACLGLNKLILVIGLLGFLPAASTAAQKSGETPIYTVGIVPQFEVRKLHRIWRPILDEVESRTGYRFKIIGSPTIPDFEKEFVSGSFDFSYMNPYHIVLASEQAGYLPLVRDVGRTLHGVLVVRVDSGIDRVTELEGKIVAFPAPNALGASLQIRQELADKFKVTFEPRYVKTHDSVYLNVVLKQAAAGGGVQRTLDRQQEEVRRLLKVIHRTTAVAPHPFAAHPRVPAKVRQEVQEALLDLGATEEGGKLFSKVPIKQIGSASLADYEGLRGMGLERFQQSYE